jgi:UDP-N-acetylglucosamine 2-epimerase
MLKIVSIVGARPQFIKISPICREIEKSNKNRNIRIEHIIVHTGQHYDEEMSQIFFEQLQIPKPDFDLGVGSGNHGFQTGRMLEKIEEVLLKQNPKFVLIFGDTNSTVAGALAASKLHITVGHVEAGLRSFNRRMPEELNRIVADHLSDMLFAPTRTALANLDKEGLSYNSLLTGDIMYDAILSFKELARQKSSLQNLITFPQNKYAVATIHRAENTDNLSNLENIMNAFNRIASDYLPLVFPVHPRTQKFVREKLQNWKPHTNLHLIDPIGYLDMVKLVDESVFVLTDSGGLQKEAFFLGKPCVTLRGETEWIETVEAKANFISGTVLNQIIDGVEFCMNNNHTRTGIIQRSVSEYFGDGNSSEIILNAILDAINKSSD